MRRTWLYLKLGVLLLAAVMMYANLQTNRVFANACSGGCANDCTLKVCCKCSTASTCGCKIQSGEEGCGACEKNSGGDLELQ
jgi:hypothetical protein